MKNYYCATKSHEYKTFDERENRSEMVGGTVKKN